MFRIVPPVDRAEMQRLFDFPGAAQNRRVAPAAWAVRIVDTFGDCF